MSGRQSDYFPGRRSARAATQSSHAIQKAYMETACRALCSKFDLRRSILISSGTDTDLFNTLESRQCAVQHLAISRQWANKQDSSGMLFSCPDAMYA